VIDHAAVWAPHSTPDRAVPNMIGAPDRLTRMHERWLANRQSNRAGREKAGNKACRRVATQSYCATIWMRQRGDLDETE
jgi:acyl CoA:acetate/3-ketoacid CoA transferase beta subunit